jgi:hypothetical protein
LLHSLAAVFIDPANEYRLSVLHPCVFFLAQGWKVRHL